MEFSSEELEMMSSNWVQEKPKWNGISPKSTEELAELQKNLPNDEYQKAYEAYLRREEKLRKVKMLQDEWEREEREEREETEKQLQKEREDKELEELIYQSIKKERDKNSKPTIVEPTIVENDEKFKCEQQAKEILQNLLKEKNILDITAKKLYNQLINDNIQPSQAKVTQVALAYQQLKELQEMSWRQALRK